MPNERQSSNVSAAPDPVVAAMPEILSFSSGPALQELRRGFVLLLSDRLGSRLGLQERRQPNSGRALSDRIDGLPMERFLRILLAPETVHRLLWPELHDDEEVARFLQRAVEAERALDHGDFELDGPTWTALGERLVLGPDDVADFALHGFPPIVLGDPSLRHPTASSPDRAAKPVSPADVEIFTEQEIGTIAARLREAHLRLLKTGAEMWSFARHLNTTLVVRKDRDPSGGFRSSSPERYVGRSVLWNPHLPEVRTADLMEALVHEAIHTVLDTADALLTRVDSPQPRWVTEPQLYDGVSRTVSPWTGRDLDVPTYVHAFLVWYALLCFWTKALLAQAVDAQTARGRIIRAGAPFMSRSALAPLEPFAGAIRPDIAELLHWIEDRVSSEFESLVPEGTS